MAELPMFAVEWHVESKRYEVKVKSKSQDTVAHSTDEMIAACVCNRLNEAFDAAIAEVAYLIDSTHHPEVV